MSKTDRLTEREGGMEGEKGRQTDRLTEREERMEGERWRGGVDRQTD